MWGNLIRRPKISSGHLGESSMKASIYIDGERVRGRINPQVYGHFLEHFHRCIYGGIYDPSSRFSDHHGFRSDVFDALKKIRTPILRWPGGCYCDAYHWKNGIGPRDERPITLDYAWDQEETNQFGTDEFVEVCHAVGAEPYINVSVGTGTAEEAAQWVEYCNRKGSTSYAQLREKNGYPKPHNVKFWGVGNEIHGGWEIGGPMTGAEYAKVFKEYAKLMRRVDPSIKLIAVGHGRDPQFNFQFLRDAGFVTDYISIHSYSYRKESLPDYYGAVASPTYAEQNLVSLISAINPAMRGSQGEKKRIEISFDEWNAWGWSHYREGGATAWGKWTRMDENDLNSQYTLREAIHTARFLNIFRRYCEHVTMANYSPIVNVRGAVYVHPDGLVLRPSYHVFDLYTNHGGEVSLETQVQCETYDAKRAVLRYGSPIEVKDIPYVDASATLSEVDGKLFLSAANLNKDEDIECQVKISNIDVSREATFYELNGPDVLAYNDVKHPDNVRILPKRTLKTGREFSYVLPAHSVTVAEIGSK